MSAVDRFVGYRHAGETWVVCVDANDEARPLDTCLLVVNHSPNGFEWGYAGSGPAQLALAMCVELVGPERAQLVHQEVKARLVAGLPRDGWTLSAADVRRAIDAAEASLT